MEFYDIPYDFLKHIQTPEEITPEEFQTLILNDPSNVQIEMEPNACGDFVPVGITYLFLG